MSVAYDEVPWINHNHISCQELGFPIQCTFLHSPTNSLATLITEMSNDNHTITFTSYKPFGLVDLGQSGLEDYSSEYRMGSHES